MVIDLGKSLNVRSGLDIRTGFRDNAFLESETDVK